MKENFIIMSLDDKRAKKISEVMSSESCKKIINLLADKDELTEKEISNLIKIPLNTTEYNLKKLLESGIVEKTSNFFWSQKGKKIPTYTLSNKSIVISPKSSAIDKIKKILPVAFVSAIAGLALKVIYSVPQKVELASEEMLFMAADSSIIAQPSSQWLWFLGGSFFVILVIVITHWRKL